MIVNKTGLNKVFKNYINYLIIAAIMLVTIPLYFGGILNDSSFVTPNMLTQMAFTIILVMSLNMVVGFLGELSLGHAGFMYVGAYVGGILCCYLYKSGLVMQSTHRLIICMLIGGLAAAIFGFIIGLPALRLRGDYLAIVTLAFGEIVRGILKNTKIDPAEGPLAGLIKNPATGFSLNSSKGKFDGDLFIFAFIVAIVVLFCIQNLMNSKHGRAIQAIKDNEIAARTMGVNITYYKLITFTIAAFFAGVAGALFANYSVVSYAQFSYNYSIEILVMVVLGGMGSLTGSIISSVLLVFINTKLQAVLTGDLASLKYLVYALILIFMMILHSAPKLAVLREKLNWGYVSGKIKGIFGKKTKNVSIVETEVSSNEEN